VPGRTADEDADEGGEQDAVEEEAAEIAARLEERPHRHDGRDGAVHEDHPAPRAHDALAALADERRQLERRGLPEPDGEADQRHEDERR
jgi:hypothetical protein